MRAVQLTEYVSSPSDLRITHVPDPTPTPTQYLISVHATATNFFDLLQIQGKYQMKPTFPWIAGNEFSGVVVQTPSNGKTPKYAVGHRVFGAALGAFATMIAAEEEQLWRVPDHWEHCDAAGVFVTAATSFAGLVTRAELRRGETVLIHGSSGGIGLAAIQIAKAIGATVIATASTTEKLSIATAYGADHAVNITSPTWADNVRSLTTDNRGVDVVLDPVGLINASLKCIAFHGRLVVVGFAGGEIEAVKMNRVLLKNVNIIGLQWKTYNEFAKDIVEDVWRQLGELIERGEMKSTWWKEGVFFGLEGVRDGLAAVRDRKSWGKVVVRIPQGE